MSNRIDKEQIRAARKARFGMGTKPSSTANKNKRPLDSDTQADNVTKLDKRAKSEDQNQAKHTKEDMSSTVSPEDAPLLVRFFDQNIKAQDARGRTLDEILSWDDRRLEQCHNYIQMLFPLPEGSMFNYDVPVITREVAEAFHARKDLRDRVEEALIRMLSFYGFQLEVVEEEDNEDQEPDAVKEDQNGDKTSSASNKASGNEPRISASSTYIKVTRAPNWDRASRNWATRFNHNHLRLSRILRSLRMLGLQDECDALFEALEAAQEDTPISASSLGFWAKANQSPLHIAPDGTVTSWIREWVEDQR